MFTVVTQVQTLAGELQAAQLAKIKQRRGDWKAVPRTKQEAKGMGDTERGPALGQGCQVLIAGIFLEGVINVGTGMFLKLLGEKQEQGTVTFSKRFSWFFLRETRFSLLSLPLRNSRV